MLKKLFKKNDSGFICLNCERVVKGLVYSSRNHCPYCLYSLHIDNNPDDRANLCKGIMKPVAAAETAKKGIVITHECLRCGELKNNKSADDDDFDMILKIMRETF